MYSTPPPSTAGMSYRSSAPTVAELDMVNTKQQGVLKEFEESVNAFLQLELEMGLQGAAETTMEEEMQGPDKSSIDVATLKRSKVSRSEFPRYFARHRVRNADLRQRESPGCGSSDAWRVERAPWQSFNHGNVSNNNNNSSSNNTIRSVRGTVRGVRNLVRTGIASFLLDQAVKDIREREQGRLVVYISSCGIIRGTRTRCSTVCKIFRNMMVRFEERDVFTSRENLQELMDRLGTPPPLPLPLIFIHGQILGDAGEVEKLNESGELKNIVKEFKDPSGCRKVCSKCGGFSMVPCHICSGSKKSGHRNFSQVILRCTNCDAAGLVKCDMC